MKVLHNQIAIIFICLVIIGIVLFYYGTNTGGIEGYCNHDIAFSHTYDAEGCGKVGCEYCSTGLCKLPGEPCGKIPSGWVQNATPKTRTMYNPNGNPTDNLEQAPQGGAVSNLQRYNKAAAEYDASTSTFVKNESQNNTNLQSEHDTISSFNMDSLYNTQDLTQKYSFLNSSFLYRPFSTNNNEYLSELYFNNSPLELEQMCKGLDGNTCSVAASCVYTNNNKCLPGNKRGPFNSYSDINIFRHNCNMMDFQMLPQDLKQNLYTLFSQII